MTESAWQVVARAWELRNDSPRLAIELAATLHDPAATDLRPLAPSDARASAGGARAQNARLALQACAVRAAARLVLDEPEAAKREVLDGIAALERLIEEQGAAASPAPAAPLAKGAATGYEAPEGEPEVARLAKRLALIDVTAIPADLAEVVAELLLVGLRSSVLSNDVDNALPFGKAALSTASHCRLPRLVALAHSDIASVYGLREFTDRAIDHLRAGIEALEAAGEPVTPTLINNLGNVYLLSDRLDEALGCFEQARVGFAEKGDSFRGAIAAANQGRVLVSQRRQREGAAALVEALQAFRALGRRPYVGATLAKLGTAYSEMGEHHAAVSWFEAALREFGDAGLPFEEEAHEAYGRALLRMGRVAEALRELERAEICSRREGADLNAIALLKEQAQALATLGRHEEAYARLSRYLTGNEELERSRGASRLSVMLIELESGLASNHELPALTSRVVAEANRTLRAQAEKLERISATDELTGLYNRRYLNRCLEEELRRARGRAKPLSLILFDVDNFKSINDRHSHLAGDEVLLLVASTLRATFRQGDVVARWGGEEFAVLLPDAGSEAALIVARKALAAVAGLDCSTIAPGLTVTISAGAACSAELSGEGLAAALLQLADRRLYQAKEAGRNRIGAG